MTDFLRSFTASLSKIDEEYKRADSDLHKVITEASNNLEQFTSGKVKLQLDLITEDKHGRYYDLLVVSQSNSAGVGTYMLKIKGYPIAFGEFVYSSGRFIPETILNDIENTYAHLDELIQNPDSPLTTQIAYFMRSEN